MSRLIVVVGLRVQAATAEHLALAADASGGAMLNGVPIATLAHLPGGLAVVECGEQFVILPWAILAQLLGRAAAAARPGGEP